ncbi:Uncharacterised protein [Kluyvera ascorbata]|nr:Uncharacterised protein [Kluyvera ascorbata]
MDVGVLRLPMVFICTRRFCILSLYSNMSFKSIFKHMIT